MAISDILSTLDDQANADCESIIGEAREHAKMIVEESERQARQIHETFVNQVERVATLNASKKVNAARLQAKMTVSSVKGAGLTSVFEDARAQLFSARDQGYDALFAALAAEALAGVSGPVTIRVTADDIALAEKAATAAGLAATVESDLDTAGGLVVETGGGKIVRRNTLEDRLDRASQFVRADVAAVLFS
jgi:vacuolar-type H+-ATPase subunit E/Vma4